jgi:cobalamin biosynthesis Co2+ chelatase CbiK
LLGLDYEPVLQALESIVVIKILRNELVLAHGLDWATSTLFLVLDKHLRETAFLFVRADGKRSSIPNVLS